MKAEIRDGFFKNLGFHQTIFAKVSNTDLNTRSSRLPIDIMNHHDRDGHSTPLDANSKSRVHRVAESIGPPLNIFCSRLASIDSFNSSVSVADEIFDIHRHLWSAPP